MTAWNPNSNSLVDTIIVVNDNIYAAGQFDSIGGLSRASLAVIDKTTGGATSWSYNNMLENNDILAAGTSLYVAGRNGITSLELSTGVKKW